MKKTNYLKLTLLAILIVFIILPFCILIFHIEKDNIRNLFYSGQFMVAIGNSVCIAFVATGISLLLALVLSWCIARIDLKFNYIFKGIFTLPMLIPSISHGMGLIILFGKNGIITNIFNLNGSIYGFWGIVMGSVLYSFPIAFLMLLDIFLYEDMTPYEVATVLKISPISQFIKITLPYLRKPLISVIFSIFTIVITDYGVPMMVGGNYVTLPVMMYQEVIGLLDFGKGAIIGLILLLPAVLAFLVDIICKDSIKTNGVVRKSKLKRGKGTCWCSATCCTITSIFVLLPIISFAIMTFVVKYPIDMTFTFKNVIKSVELKGLQYWTNSLIIAVSVGFFGTALAFVIAYFTARTVGKLSKMLHLSALISLAIPGIVLGLSYCLTFKSSWIYGTLIILILVNTIHFLSSPYLMMYNSMKKINSNIESIGMVLGISKVRIVKDVILPQTQNTIIEMFGYFFVNCMMTISAVSFLATIRNKPVSLMITQFEAQMLIECAAFVSLLILGTNLIIKGILYYIRCKLTY